MRGRVSFLKAAEAQFETPNAKIGTVQDGWRCGNSSDIVWSNKVYKLFSAKLDKTFRGVLDKAHYPIPLKVDAIFDAPSDIGRPVPLPELQVGMLIKDISANFCLTEKGGLGGAYMKVY